MPRDCVTFGLNGAVERVTGLPPTTTLLNYLRRQKRLTGTKEGCAEGDCGACTVALCERTAAGVRTRAVNSCILLLPMLEGKSVTTVEGVTGEDGKLHPCQQALVEAHGSQCGFCTPGFVMTLYADYKTPRSARGPNQELTELLAGNLCRCTGYGPILEAASRMRKLPKPAGQRRRREREAALLSAMGHQPTVDYRAAGGRAIIPATLDEALATLAEHPEATLLAGATDVGLWVTKQHRELPLIVSLGRVGELKTIEETADALILGAGVTYTDALPHLVGLAPDLGDLLARLGSPLVRNSGTVGGNIANGSPIGDTPPALIALGARIELRSAAGAREIALEDFFLAYGRQDRRAGELLTRIVVPRPGPGDFVRAYKLSKRRDQDISSVLGCFKLSVEGGIVRSARIAFGGMAGVPKRARGLEAALTGRPWSRAAVEPALAALTEDFAPLSDHRGSASYRLAAAEGLVRRCLIETAKTKVATRIADAVPVL